jgi:hypothetical protein
MTIAEHEAGSQTATVTTEHVLNTTTPETTDGIYQLVVDASAMVNGDELELRIKEKCRAGDTQRLAWFASYAHVQGSPLIVSPALVLLHGWDVTLKQTAGTGRAFPWSIRKVT